MLTLRAGASVLTLSPEHGGAIDGWTWGAERLLHRVRGVGCFPLVPYANRIAQGRFSWNRLSHQIPRNFGDHPHSIHGIGWQRPWVVEGTGGDHARLTLAHDGARGWPFAFTAEQMLTLRGDSLLVELRMTNRHDATAPAGLGLHPFFRRPPGARLRFNAASVWQTDATALADRRVAIPPAWDHAAGLTVDATALDHCFAGWDGVAELDLGTARLTIETSAAFSHIQVYTPPNEAYFCVEPVSHRPDAINALNEMTSLAPGATLSGTIAFHMTKASS